MRELLLERKAVGLCTPKQARQLLELGIDARDMFYDEAKERLGAVRKQRRGVADGSHRAKAEPEPADAAPQQDWAD